MIVTVTLNAALDVTYTVDRLEPDTSHRVRAVHQRAGGKGVNVARVLHGMGRAVTCLGFTGGPTGDAILADLGTAGIAHAMTPIACESRRTVSVVSRATGGSTLFNEPGPSVSGGEWQAFLEGFVRAARDARVVVLSGSIPPGVPSDAYARLVRAAGDVPVIVDADGMALREALPASPAVVKPNRAELLAASGHMDPDAAMHVLRAAGARAVVATFGSEGIRALTADGAWKARLTAPVTVVNPTGAGDAVAAAIAVGLEEGWGWQSILEDALAWSAAAVAAPLAGDIDGRALDAVRRLARVEVV